MKPFPDLVVTLELGDHRRTLRAGDLADDLREWLVRLLLGAGTLSGSVDIHSVVHGKEGEGDGWVLPDPRTNAISIHRFRAFQNREGKEVGSGEEPRGGTDASPLAVELADRLDDWKSLPFYDLVARRVPADLIRDALTRALDVPSSRLRRSRAAYFTALVRPHLGRR